MPEPLPDDPVDREMAVRSLVAAELVAAASVDPPAIRPRVETRPRFVSSEPEWLSVAGIKHPQSAAGGMETRAVFLSFDDFTEVDDGKCDQTILTLTYGVDVLFQLVERRRDGSNGHDDFVAYLMRARARFKQNRSFGYERNQLEHKLLRVETKARVEPLDYGGIVHRINLLLDVEVG
ncbi:MAG: hypothetical protein WCF57_20260 [Pyrinomonadaceae bacterium]